MVFFVGNGIGDSGSIPERGCRVSQNANTLRGCKNKTILSLAMGRLQGRLSSLNLVGQPI